MKKLVLIISLLISGQTLFAQGPGRYEFSAVINDCIKTSMQNYQSDGSLNVGYGNNVDGDASAPPENFFDLCEPSSGAYQNTSVISYNPDSANNFCPEEIYPVGVFNFKVKGMRHGQSATYININNEKGYAKATFTCTSNNNFTLVGEVKSLNIENLYCNSKLYKIKPINSSVDDNFADEQDNSNNLKSEFPRKVLLPKIKINEIFEKTFFYNNNKYKIKHECTQSEAFDNLGSNPLFQIKAYNSVEEAESKVGVSGISYLAKITKIQDSCDFSKIRNKSWSQERTINGITRNFSCYGDDKYMILEPSNDFSSKMIITAKSKEGYQKSFKDIQDIEENLDKTYGYQVLSCHNGMISVDESFCSTYEVRESSLTCDGKLSESLNEVKQYVDNNGLQVINENSSQSSFPTASSICSANERCRINDKQKQTTKGPVKLGGKIVKCQEKY